MSDRENFRDRKCSHEPCTCEGPCVFSDDTWEDVFYELARDLHRYFSVRLENPQDVDGRLQDSIEISLRLILQGRLDKGENIIPFVWGVAKNVLKKFRSSKQRPDLPYEKGALDDAFYSTSHHRNPRALEESIEKRELYEMLLEASHLTNLEAKVFSLRIINDLSLEEITFVLDKSPKSVSDALYRARKKLRGSFAIERVKNYLEESNL